MQNVTLTFASRSTFFDLSQHEFKKRVKNPPVPLLCIPIQWNDVVNVVWIYVGVDANVKQN